MKNVMKMAWSIARKGAKTHGGSAKEYFAQSLKLAWKQVKAMADKDFVVFDETYKLVALLNRFKFDGTVSHWSPNAETGRLYFNLKNSDEKIYVAIKADADRPTIGELSTTAIDAKIVDGINFVTGLYNTHVSVAKNVIK